MSDIDISREAVEQLALLHLKEGDNFSSLTATTLRILRAALDAQAGVTVKSLVWTEYAPYWKACASDYEYSINIAADGVHFSVSTRGYVFGLNNAWRPLGGGYPSLEAAKSAAQADYARRILSALEPIPSPLAEVAMRERAADAIADAGAPFLGCHIRALPTTFTHAELLAAVGKVPEVMALVGAAKALEMWDASRGYPVPYRIRDPLRAALAPFTRKGE